MKKLLNAAAITAFIATLGLAAVSCTPKEPVRPAEKQLGVSIEVKSATENTVTAEIVAGKDATSYTYAIGEAGKLNEFTNGTMEGITTQNDPSIKEVTFEGLSKATDYTIYAQASDGQLKGTVRQRVVTTEGQPDIDLSTSAILDNATEDSFVIKVEFGANTRTLVYGYGNADDLEAFENGSLNTITKVNNPTSGTIIVRGMERGTEYTVFVQAVAGDQKGNVSIVSGKTLQIDLELVLVEELSTPTSATVEMRPGGDTVKYRYMLGAMELLEYFENCTWPDILWVDDVTKPFQTAVTGMAPGESYCIFAQPFAANGTRGEIEIIEVSGSAPEE